MTSDSIFLDTLLRYLATQIPVLIALPAAIVIVVANTGLRIAARPSSVLSLSCWRCFPRCCGRRSSR
ncbi:hypothetical protein [Fodinicola feengrottensis]|uniref:hypothetical protein n=1 Tax=Fodinicola feengrottensis TaxID=435914 RepID=UPI0013D70E70|nr:hypothetical protein [Fodinicola feengrottensis]